MFAMITSILQNKKGQGMVEYGLILSLVSVVVIAAVALIGTDLNIVFGKVTTELSK